MFGITGRRFARRGIVLKRAATATAGSKNLLDGLFVLELSSVLAGPTVGQFFGELGANVVKVENKKTRGDVTRTWVLPEENPEDDRTAYFRCCNLGKRSLAVDISTREGLRIVHDLATTADVVVASYKPGDAEKLSVDYASLKRLNPRLIYAQITGYGSDDDRAGYDAVVQAHAGFQYMNGAPDEAPPTKMPVAMVDLLAAHQLKEGVLLGLLRRERTGGEGSFVEVSLLQAAVSSLANQATGYLCANVVPVRRGSDHPYVPASSLSFRSARSFVSSSHVARPVVLLLASDRSFRTVPSSDAATDVGSSSRSVPTRSSNNCAAFSDATT